MPSELRRFMTVLVLLAATLAGQPRWLDETRAEDSPGRAWQRSLSTGLAPVGQPSEQLQASHQAPAASSSVMVPARQQRPRMPAFAQRPAVLRGSGAPRAPDGIAAV